MHRSKQCRHDETIRKDSPVEPEELLRAPIALRQALDVGCARVKERPAQAAS